MQFKSTHCNANNPKPDVDWSAKDYLTLEYEITHLHFSN